MPELAGRSGSLYTPSIRTTVSPATAAVAALASEQGFARVVQAVSSVPVGETYHVAATAGGVKANAARTAEQKPRMTFDVVRNTTRGFPRAEAAIPGFRHELVPGGRLNCFLVQ